MAKKKTPAKKAPKAKGKGKAKKPEAKAPKFPPAKVEKYQEAGVRCPLSTEEVAKRAERAAHLLQERDDKEAAMKASAKHQKGVIENVEAEFRRLSAEVRDKVTFRTVDCERETNWETGMYTERRLDTGEVTFARALTAEERQREMFPEEPATDPKPPAPGSGKPPVNDEFSEEFGTGEEPEPPAKSEPKAKRPRKGSKPATTPPPAEDEEPDLANEPDLPPADEGDDPDGDNAEEDDDQDSDEGDDSENAAE